MSVRNWVAGVAAAGSVLGGIALVQSGITGSPWPSSAPGGRSVSSPDPGLPAPGERRAAPVPAGTVAEAAPEARAGVGSPAAGSGRAGSGRAADSVKKPEDEGKPADKPGDEAGGDRDGVDPAGRDRGDGDRGKDRGAVVRGSGADSDSESGSGGDDKD